MSLVEANAPVRDHLVGVPADRVDLEGAVEFIASRLAVQRRTRILVTNANKAWLASRSPRLREILCAAELVIPEWAMVWAARRLGLGPLHNVGGIGLMSRLLEEADRRGWSVYLLGARPEVVETLASKVRAERPGLDLVGWHHGYLDPELDQRVRAELADLRPDLLFVALGSPRQEEWIADAWPEIGVGAALGVGGSFDVLSGFKRDAPRWLHGNGLEWLFRLSQDPRRLWKRYLITNTWFVWSVYRERLLVSERPRRGVRGARGGG